MLRQMAGFFFGMVELNRCPGFVVFYRGLSMKIIEIIAEDRPLTIAVTAALFVLMFGILL